MVELQKWGRTLLMLPFWHLVLTGGWNKASLRTKARIRGKKGENIRAQLEALQALIIQARFEDELYFDQSGRRIRRARRRAGARRFRMGILKTP